MKLAIAGIAFLSLVTPLHAAPLCSTTQIGKTVDGACIMDDHKFAGRYDGCQSVRRSFWRSAETCNHVYMGCSGTGWEDTHPGWYHEIMIECPAGHDYRWTMR